MYKKLIYLVSFVFVLSLVLPNAVEADLVGQWKLDEGSGTMDSSGNGFDILLPDTTTWEEGLFGGAAHFQGVGEGNVGNFRYRLQWSSKLFDNLNS